MGFSIALVDKDTRDPVQVRPFSAGSVYAIGGSDEADISITYNYSKLYARVPSWDGKTLRNLVRDQRAGDILPKLREGLAHLGSEKSADYWEPTPGNAGAILKILVGWAEDNPDAIFTITSE